MAGSIGDRPSPAKISLLAIEFAWKSRDGLAVAMVSARLGSDGGGRTRSSPCSA